MTTEKYGGESVPDASGYTMDPAEVLRRAEAFDPLAVVAVGATTPPCRFCNNTGVIGFGSFENACHECDSANHEPTIMTPIMRREAIMRLALQMIVRQTTFPDSFAAQIARRTAEQALRECGK
jgi:hypothetical protein|tara:strand:+ start:1871 stop:2239 length:369 start_codon:yes stop_codon:yes gene_type:complete